MSNWLDKYFIEHPKTVDESYLEHLVVALSFSCRLLAAGAACLVHALVPGLFVKTGSSMIDELYSEMVQNRHRNNTSTVTSEVAQETAR